MSITDISCRIKKARLDAGLTQKQVAEKLGITYQAISNYERGANRIDTDTLSKLCRIYCIQISDLINDYETICMTFGQRLRLARKEKQLTQKELAAKINAKHNSISNWENDQNMPDPDTIQNLCWALDVQPNFFFSVDDTLPHSSTPSLSSPMISSLPGSETNILSQEEDRILYKFHHGLLLPDITSDEIDIIKKFRHLDDRGKASVLSILKHEYDSLIGEDTPTSPKEA